MFLNLKIRIWTLFLFVPFFTVAQIRTITIDISKRYQTIDNFAASDAWSGQYVGKYWAETEKDRAAEFLFSTEVDTKGNPRGIGLSLWRVNVGAGTIEQDGADILPVQRRAESFLIKNGSSYDWSKNAGAEYFMRQSVKWGSNNFLLFSNSPPVQFTLNGKGWSGSDHSANIKPDSYDKFAAYLADVASHYLSRGFNIRYISPINEPQVKWNTPRQEGSPWQKGQIKRVLVELNKALNKRPELSSVRMLAGETANLKVIYEQDSVLRKRFTGEEAPDEQGWAYFNERSPYYIGNLNHLPRIIAGHSYHNHKNNVDLRKVRKAVGEFSLANNLEYHQTEWCLLPNYLPPMDGFTADWSSGNRADIQTGLLMGRIIYSDMVDGNARAWGYWKAMELNGDHALLSLHAIDNNILNGGTVSANKILWALGNYSLFIRPGFVRIETTGADDLDNLVASSYISPDRSRIVTVLVNSSFNEEQIKLNLKGDGRRRAEKIQLYHTNAEFNLSRITGKNDLNGLINIPPRTLTTIVTDLEK